MSNIPPGATENVLQGLIHVRRVRDDVYDLDDRSFEMGPTWVGKPVLCGGRVVGKVSSICHDAIQLVIDPAEHEFVSAHFKNQTTPSIGVSSHGH